MRIHGFAALSLLAALFAGVARADPAQGPIRIGADQCLNVYLPDGGVSVALVQTWTCTGTPDQQWRVTRDGAIINLASGKCLDVPAHARGRDGTRLQVWACTGRNNQAWDIRGDDAAGHVVTARGSAMCLDVHQPVVWQDGAVVQVRACDGGTSQRWAVPELPVAASVGTTDLFADGDAGCVTGSGCCRPAPGAAAATLAAFCPGH